MCSCVLALIDRFHTPSGRPTLHVWKVVPICVHLLSILEVGTCQRYREREREGYGFCVCCGGHGLKQNRTRGTVNFCFVGGIHNVRDLGVQACVFLACEHNNGYV